VKSKLALEDMQPNEILRIIVDHFPATENVPRSMQNEGNDVLKVAEVSDSAWEIIIRKCG
jgi:TusA-related sulfurtransferase